MKFTSVTSQRVIGSGETGKSNDFFFQNGSFLEWKYGWYAFFSFIPFFPFSW